MSPALWPHGALPLSTSPFSRARIDAGRPTRSNWIGNGRISASRRRHPRDQVNLLPLDRRQRVGRAEWLGADPFDLLDEVAGPVGGRGELPLPGDPQQVLLPAGPRRLDGIEAAVQPLLLDVRGRMLAQKRGHVAIQLPHLGLQVGRVGLEGPCLVDALPRARPCVVGAARHFRAQGAGRLLAAFEQAQAGAQLADDLALARERHETEIDPLSHRGAEDVPRALALDHTRAGPPGKLTDGPVVLRQRPPQLLAVLLARLRGSLGTAGLVDRGIFAVELLDLVARLGERLLARRSPFDRRLLHTHGGCRLGEFAAHPALEI